MDHIQTPDTRSSGGRETPPRDVPVPVSPVAEDGTGVKRNATPDYKQSKRHRASSHDTVADDVPQDEQGLLRIATVGLHTTISLAIPEEEETGTQQQLIQQAWDDATGAELDAAEVRKARKKGVWSVIPELRHWHEESR